MAEAAKIPRGWVEIPENAAGMAGDRVEINGEWYESDFPGHRSLRYHRYIRRAGPGERREGA